MKITPVRPSLNRREFPKGLSHQDYYDKVDSGEINGLAGYWAAASLTVAFLVEALDGVAADSAEADSPPMTVRGRVFLPQVSTHPAQMGALHLASRIIGITSILKTVVTDMDAIEMELDSIKEFRDDLDFQEYLAQAAHDAPVVREFVAATEADRILAEEKFPALQTSVNRILSGGYTLGNCPEPFKSRLLGALRTAAESVDIEASRKVLGRITTLGARKIQEEG